MEVCWVFLFEWEFGRCWRQWTQSKFCRFSHCNAALHKHNDMSNKLIPGASRHSTSQSTSQSKRFWLHAFTQSGFLSFSIKLECFSSKQYYLWQTLQCLLTCVIKKTDSSAVIFNSYEGLIAKFPPHFHLSKYFAINLEYVKKLRIAMRLCWNQLWNQ